MVALTEQIAREIRKQIIKMHRIGPNVGSAMSIADILAVLYFDVMNIDSPDDPDRDRFILSKGHAVSALYAVLAKKGFFEEALLDQYLSGDGPMAGHPARGAVPGIEVTTGSLGHGLPIAVGMAMAAKNDGKKHHIFVLMGDGECQEGSVWESAILAPRLALDNITVIVDANNLQGYQRTEKILPRHLQKGIWEAFGWATVEIDGHDVSSLKNTLLKAPFEKGKPSAIIAKTIKGKGVAEMEDKMGWHYYSVPADKLDSFLEELDKSK